MQEIKQQLQAIFPNNEEIAEQVWQWYDTNTDEFNYQKSLTYSLNELSFHAELLPEKKQALLTSEEHLKTFYIRRNGLKTLPNEWIDSGTGKVDVKVLDDLWLKPTEGYLVRMLQESGDKRERKHLKKDVQDRGLKYRGIDKGLEERTQIRLGKIQQSVDKQEVVLFLGRQNRGYTALQKKLNEKYWGQLSFINDDVWSSRGYTEPGIKVSDNRLSLIQAVETIDRLPKLGITGEAVNQRFIMLSLDGYDMRSCLAAIYSNCNHIARSQAKPKIDGMDKFDFAYTGLTDMELANIVRNKHWFDHTRFCRTGANGEAEELTQQQVREEYGIKYIGDLMRKTCFSK